MQRTLLTAKELAPKLGIARCTVLAWVRRGWIPCLRGGQRPVLFDLDEVKAALRRRAQERREGGSDAK